MLSIIISNWSREPSNGSLSSFYLKEAEESSGSSSLLYDSGVAQDQDSQDPDSRSSSPEMIPPGWLKTSGVAKVFFFHTLPGFLDSTCFLIPVREPVDYYFTELFL